MTQYQPSKSVFYCRVSKLNGFTMQSEWDNIRQDRQAIPWLGRDGKGEENETTSAWKHNAVILTSNLNINCFLLPGQFASAFSCMLCTFIYITLKCMSTKFMNYRQVHDFKSVSAKCGIRTKNFRMNPVGILSKWVLERISRFGHKMLWQHRKRCNFFIQDCIFHLFDNGPKHRYNQY